MAKREGRQMPGGTEVAAALSRVLASRAFDRAGRSSAFLRFVVEEALAGRGGRLKGFTIAVEVFGRTEDFDAQTDPLVRVEAGRLRRRLVEYYHQEGRADPILIELSRGGYLPSFAYNPAAERDSGGNVGLAEAAVGTHGARSPAMPAEHAAWRWPLILGALAGAAALVVSALVIWSPWKDVPAPEAGRVLTETAPPPAVASDADRPTGAGGRREPRMIVLPIANIGNDGDFDAFAAGLTEEIIRALVAFDILATASPTAGSIESLPLQSLREEFDAGYALTGSVRTTDDGVRVAARLMDTDAGTQLWTHNFDETATSSDSLAAEESIARSIVMMIASPFGPVYGNEIRKAADKPAADLDPYECLLRFYGYARTFDPKLHADSVLCMQRAVLSEPAFGSAWSALATLYLHEHMFGYTPQPDRGPPLDRALEAARRALDIDGSDLVAAVDMVGIQFALRDEDAFERAVDRALSITPSHPAVLANVGYSLTLAGQWQRGIPLLDDALPVTAEPPGWYYTSYAFRYLETGDYDDALEWALKIDAPNWFATPLTVAATAAYAGRLDLAQREVERLLELYPDFERTGRERLIKWTIQDELRETLITGLRLAGMQIT